MKALSSDYYIEPKVYAAERRNIFRSAWWLVCPVRTVSQPGSYFSDCVCGWPVFVLRGADGVLRGFRNVCRHRGAMLLESGCGSTGRILCPYHGWLYADDGRLLNAPHFAEAELPRDSLGLLEIEVREWNGLAFLKLDGGEGLEFEQWIGEIDRLSANYPGPDDLTYHGAFAVSGEFNWKLYCENTVEGYHLHSVHERLGKAVADGEVSLFSVNSDSAVVFDVSYGAKGEKTDGRAGKGLWIYSYPGFQLVLGENLFKAERVESSGVCTTRSVNWSWYGGMDLQQREDAFLWAKTIVEEDMGICTSVFNNMKAGNFVPGPLSCKMESHVGNLQTRIRSAVDPKT